MCARNLSNRAADELAMDGTAPLKRTDIRGFPEKSESRGATEAAKRR